MARTRQAYMDFSHGSKNTHPLVKRIYRWYPAYIHPASFFFSTSSDEVGCGRVFTLKVVFTRLNGIVRTLSRNWFENLEVGSR